MTAAGFLPIGFAVSSTGEYAGAIFSVVGIALLLSGIGFLILARVTVDIASRTVGKQIVLKANPNYKGNRPHRSDTIVMTMNTGI